MRIPRRHRFRSSETAEQLFARLPPIHRFRLAKGQDGVTSFGSDPLEVVSGTDAWDGQALRGALPCVPDARISGFPGGAIGYLTYEMGAPMVGIGAGDHPSVGAPLPGWFGIYDTFARFDSRSSEVEVVSWGRTDDGAFDPRRALERAERLEETLRTGDGRASDPTPDPTPIRASLTRHEHAQGVESILEAIRRGDIYQANLTVRFDVDLPGTGVDLFEQLLRDNPSPYAAFLEAEGATVVSCSPERLLSARGRDLETRPIKGTVLRGENSVEDRELAQMLLNSTKDRAELLMITDLLRNDLGRVCAYGTVRVPQLQSLESFAHVHHLVSTVRGQLRPDLDVFDALAALFPCGSITGAPKRRAMEILRELEPCPRGVYTGTLGWVGFDRSADFNVAIRTGHLRDGTFSFGAGGGIVIDSNPDSEWDELHWKARAFLLALGQPAEAMLE